MPRGNLKAKICRLCLNNKCDIDFKVVEVIKEVLEIVLPKLNLEEGDKHLICGSCSVKLFAAFNFKSVCMDTEDTIFPYVNSQETPWVDLREVYLKEKGNVQLIDILEYQKICRLCFQSVGYGFVSLNKVDADIIDNYIPEVNFNATKDPVICRLCFDSLVTHGVFLNGCLAAQEQNRNVCSKENKIEDDGDSGPAPRLADVETMRNYKGRRYKDIRVINKKHPPKKVPIYKCTGCDFKSQYKASLTRHCLNYDTSKHISPKRQYKRKSGGASSSRKLKHQAVMYRCKKCHYRTDLKDAFLHHRWTHEVSSEVKVYQCEECHYRSKRKDYFLRHQLKHDGGGKVQIFTCDNCDFQTKYKISLLRHQLRHETKKLKNVKYYTTGDGAQIYKCKLCVFKTKDKYHFLVHRSHHARPSKQQKFKCPMCAYESDDKDKLTRHQAKHSTGMKTLKCDLCSYQTIWRPNFIRHQLRHKKACEVKTYSCFKCSFRTKYGDNLKRHELLHSVLE